MPLTAEDQHPLERRAQALAQGITSRVNMMASMMRPDGRPVFHTRLSDAKALDFWRKHRYDELGQSVISTWRPDQILDLDQRLSQANEADGLGVPQYGTPSLG